LGGEIADDARERRSRILPVFYDEIPPRERAAAVREMHERSTLAVKPEPVEPLSDQSVRLNIRLGAAGLGSNVGSPLRITSTHKTQTLCANGR
jgi:hypothetical protein